jgi:putative flippase GtrA
MSLSLRRFLRFNVVAIAGLAVQLATLWVLIHMAGLHYAVATVAAVSAALVHNFIWHCLWTWQDRAGRLGWRILTGRFGQFVAANGAVSLVGNVAIAMVLVSGRHLSPVVANLVAVAMCGLINFWLADRLVFTATPRRVSGHHVP